MFRTMLKSKIHRATVTQADLHYVGSLTVDQDLMDAADLLPGEQVSLVDVTNGARLETYLVAGERGGGVVGINGAAAHLVLPGDLVIIIAYAAMADSEARRFQPKIVLVDADNRISDVGGDPAHAPAGSGLVSVPPIGLVRSLAEPAGGELVEPAETADAARLDELINGESEPAQ